MKILITGITGFAGSHLSRYLRSIDGMEVSGLDLRAPDAGFTDLFSGEPPVVHCCNLADSEPLTEIIEQEAPDAVVHLAARAQVAGAWKEAPGILETNIVCTQVLMQALHEKAPDARMLLISSSEVYGKVDQDRLPAGETSALKPNNPYSVSKVAQEFVALQYHEAFGAQVIIARPFNHVGPKQVGNFVVPAFAKQIAEMEAGLREPLMRVGNLESQRDFTDVRDVVRAYHLLLMGGKAGEAYNIASGTTHPISEILEKLIKLSTVMPEVENIPELMRPSDTPVVVGDAGKLKALGEWQPVIPLEQSLKDALDYWREQVKILGASA
ncbi:MAG: GDP-mannose 4,6-dehydratase [Actinobacteria bacterium]|nr:GDP-mannose 4,6-dehydratase [Actinomycetota bacterium]